MVAARWLVGGQKTEQVWEEVISKRPSPCLGGGRIDKPLLARKDKKMTFPKFEGKKKKDGRKQTVACNHSTEVHINLFCTMYGIVLTFRKNLEEKDIKTCYRQNRQKVHVQPFLHETIPAIDVIRSQKILDVQRVLRVCVLYARVRSITTSLLKRQNWSLRRIRISSNSAAERNTCTSSGL